MPNSNSWEQVMTDKIQPIIDLAIETAETYFEENPDSRYGVPVPNPLTDTARFAQQYGDIMFDLIAQFDNMESGDRDDLEVETCLAFAIFTRIVNSLPDIKQTEIGARLYKLFAARQ